jgi:hypothetical protein
MRRTIQRGFDSEYMGVEPDWDSLWSREAKLKKNLKLDAIDKELREI